MTDTTHDHDGHVKFVVAATRDVLLRIDERGRLSSNGRPITPNEVSAMLWVWVGEADGDQEGEVADDAGDIVFGVPSAPAVLRLCAYGDVCVNGSVVSRDLALCRKIYRWMAGSMVDLPDGSKGIDMKTPLSTVRHQKPYSNENYAFSPSKSNHQDGVRFRFTSGSGKGPDREGGDIVFTAGASQKTVAH